MATFCIDTQTGQVATYRQLVAAGIASTMENHPPRPWLRIRGSDDATTMWYAVLRKQEKGIFIGSLAFRHNDHHASLLAAGWEEVPIGEIGIPGAPQPKDSEQQAADAYEM